MEGGGEVGAKLWETDERDQSTNQEGGKGVCEEDKACGSTVCYQAVKKYILARVVE